MSYFRSPRTRQELRQPEPTRSKRRNLPSAWDDIPRRPQRCWKAQRKTHFRLPIG
jgi:hypothetical protein